MILTEQEFRKIEKSLTDALSLLRKKQREANAPLPQTDCEELIDWMINHYQIDGMITREFIDEYYRLCKERGIQNTFHDNTISNRVKKYGYIIVDKKIVGNKWRIFKKDEGSLNL